MHFFALVLYIPHPRVFQSDFKEADSARWSVQASPGTSLVWLIMSNWPFSKISPINTGFDKTTCFNLMENHENNAKNHKVIFAGRNNNEKYRSYR